ncbi:MAG: UDP-N-acetylmuramoyl-tripeptide--D-alanyl-D-alanine ligase [Cyclobacteriaceae bacterium]|nr:MAG: UDP-N-acetylmuramoyl-tripeptide--D-alanyl-D-alanine ligase [Cyclobacteriaceae bacterium]
MDAEKLYAIYRKCTGVSTDTRTLQPGNIFFALKGEQFDGNRFAGEALKKGALFAVIDDATLAVDNRYVVVDNALSALQQLARYHRSKLTIPFIGLTGSNGKTTSKELVSTMLAKKYNVFATKGNLNNHIGVPLSVLSVKPETEIAVIEMGANHVGEIAALCGIARPTHGFITNIGKAHIGTFGGFENIVRGKTELYDYLQEAGGTVFINSQNTILMRFAHRFKNTVRYPSPEDYCHCELLSADPYVRIRMENGLEVQTQLPGRYNFENIAVALCVAKYFGVPAADAAAALAAYVPVNMRSQVVQKGSNTILLDAYNANPTSMKAALENLAEMKAPRKVAILGDMFELEEEAEKEHEAIGRLLTCLDINEVYLCGKLMKSAAGACEYARHFENKQQLAGYLSEHPLTGALVLIKGSRGMALETLIDLL